MLQRSFASSFWKILESMASVINSASALLELLDTITDLPVDPPSLYFDLKGVNLGQPDVKCQLCLLVLHVAPQNKTYLIDVLVFGQAAFTISNSSGNSLKNVLESAVIPKVIFDVRDDAKTLYLDHGIIVNGIIDLQLVAIATFSRRAKHLPGWRKCIMDCQATSSMAILGKGDHMGDLTKRPLKKELVERCATDLECLPHLWHEYDAKLRRPDQGFWRSMVREATRDRLLESQSNAFDPKSEDQALSPWNKEFVEEESDAWNDQVLGACQSGETLDENDYWVDNESKKEDWNEEVLMAWQLGERLERKQLVYVPKSHGGEKTVKPTIYTVTGKV